MFVNGFFGVQIDTLNGSGDESSILFELDHIELTEGIFEMNHDGKSCCKISH